MKLNKNLIYKKELIFKIFLLIFSFSINHYFGFQGFNFIDSFQHISGGQKALNGEIPFKDYWISDSGPLMDFTQALLFKIFGSDWNILVLNASLANIIFAFSVYWLCNIFKIEFNIKIIISILAAVIMYPASGTPLIDFHSIIFSVLGFVMFIYFSKKNDYKKLTLVPIIYFIAFFFKQVPAAYFALIILIISTYYFFNRKRYILYSQIVGTIIGFFISLTVFYFFDIKILTVYEQYFLMPFFQLFERTTDNTIDTSFFSTSQKIRYIILLIIPALITLYHHLTTKKKFDHELKVNFFIIISLFLIGILHESYTLNQSTTLGLLPLITIFLILLSNIKNKKLEYSLYLINIVILIRLVKLDINYLFLVGFLLFSFSILSKKIINSYIIRNLIILYFVLTTIFYFDKLILNRKWQDIYNPNWKQDSLDASKIDSKLKGLRWISNDPDTKNEFLIVKNNLNYLKTTNNEGEYILITHYQIYNFILNKKNLSPVKYWWKNASFPVENIFLKKKFDETFLLKIQKHNIKRIIVLKDVKIYKKFDIKDFDWLINCSILDKKNSNNFREIYIIIKKCKI